jgi:membrane protease subunit (stomatin/prohibitin family)
MAPNGRSVISTLNNEGREVMEPGIVLYHYPQNDIVSGSLLTVESNHFCVLKSRGAILNVYEGGQFTISTPDKPILGSIQQAFFSGQSPWQYEVLYLSRAKQIVRATGRAFSEEMAELEYEVNYYFHIPSKEGAIKLVTHLAPKGHFIKSDEINDYALPVIEQAVNQIVQCTKLEEVNEKIHDITSLVQTNLQEFFNTYGIHLDSVKLLIYPKDPMMKQLINLKAFGITDKEAIQYYIAMIMANNGVISAPNMAVGKDFNISGLSMVPNGLLDNKVKNNER